MERRLFVAAAAAAFLGVVLGAFGTHALRARLSPEMLVIWETGVRYQMYHAFGLFAAAWAETRWPGRLVRLAGGLFVAGVVVFSGSLYGLSLSGVRALGAITPLGGAAQLAGWILLILAAARGRR